MYSTLIVRVRLLCNFVFYCHLTIDNVERDYPMEPQIYNVKISSLLEHGSIMITGRSPNLQQKGTSLKLGVVDEGQEIAILSNTSRRSFVG